MHHNHNCTSQRILLWVFGKRIYSCWTILYYIRLYDYAIHWKESGMFYRVFYKKRIIRIFPEYWFSWCVLLVIRIIIHQVPYKHLYSPIADLLLLENIGLPFELEGINYPCWYLSVLLWGGTLVFVLARFLPTKVYRILSVISIIFFMDMCL